VSSEQAASESGRSVKVVAGDTRTQLSAGTEPAAKEAEAASAPAPSSVRRWLVPGGVAALLTVGVMAALSSIGKDAAPAPSATATLVAAPVAEPFTLGIDSTPPGAEVFEGAQLLGTTPLKLTLASPEPGKLRVLQLRKAGFKPYTVEQGPARGEVRIHAALVAEERGPASSAEPKPEPAAQIASAAAPQPRRPAPQSVPAKKPPAAAPAATPADIRLQR
jgi:serine/threonine-protein kinase